MGSFHGRDLLSMILCLCCQLQVLVSTALGGIVKAGGESLDSGISTHLEGILQAGKSSLILPLWHKGKL